MSGSPQAMADLAARYGLVDATSRERYRALLVAAVQSGRPTSLSRILIAEGQAPEVLAAILASGEHASAVLCDACGVARSQKALTDRLEVPCTGCGSLIMGFRAFAKPPQTRRVRGGTERYGEVLAAPEDDENNQTSPYGIVLPTPPAPHPDGLGAPTPAPSPDEAFDALLQTITTTKTAPPQPEDVGFSSAEDLVEKLKASEEEEGEATIDGSALARARLEAGVEPGQPLLQVEAVKPPPSDPPQERSLWPLFVVLILLLGASAAGIFLLLQK